MPRRIPTRRPRRHHRSISVIDLPDAKVPPVEPVNQVTDSVYHVYMAALAMLAIVVAVGLIIAPSEPDVIGVLTIIDAVLCLFFFYDFLRHLWKAPIKSKYLLGWGIVDFLSCVPFVLEARWLRAARLLRLLMLVRAVRVLRESAQIERRSVVMAAATFFVQISFIVICIIVLHVEHDAPGGNIRSASDVLWWAIATMTTVGYGDRYPVTDAGRIAGATLMICGIGYLATVLGVFAQAVAPQRKARKHG